MAARHLVSRTFDPLFALSIGLTSFWVRVRREEIERWHLWHYVDPTPSSSSSSESSSSSSSSPSSSPLSSSAPDSSSRSNSSSNIAFSSMPAYLQPSTPLTAQDPLRPSQTSSTPSSSRDPGLSQPSQPNQLRTAPRPSRLSYYPQSHKSSTAVEGYLRNLDHEPTMGDTWGTLVRRVHSIDVRGFEWSSLWRGRESWGVVD